MNDFEQVFGTPPAASADAPGRVNLLGEHTDYNDGFVLPTAIPQRTTVRVGSSPDGLHHFYSVELGRRVTVPPGALAAADNFAVYLLGCIEVLEREGCHVPPLCLHVTSTVPIGSGLSSSAALEVATLRALRQWQGFPLDDVRLAVLAQRAEVEYAGVSCGIMDQMAASLADTRHMLFLDTRTLERKLLPFPAGAEVMVIDSGVARTLAGSSYNQRRAECEEAARLLGAKALREVTSLKAIEILPEPLQRRARHVITENARVLEAAGGVDAERFGALMDASHASLRDDYEVSVPALDGLVALLQHREEVFGARLTGAGFGGACVALVASGRAQRVASEVLHRYNHTGQQGHLLVPRILRAPQP